MFALLALALPLLDVLTRELDSLIRACHII
jgi:hypothetical protein